MSNLHEMKYGSRDVPILGQRKLYTCEKIKYRETRQKCSQEHLDHITELQGMRSKTRRKTQRAMIKV
jgi:hypothetical protein